MSKQFEKFMRVAFFVVPKSLEGGVPPISNTGRTVENPRESRKARLSTGPQTRLDAHLRTRKTTEMERRSAGERSAYTRSF